MVMKKISLLFSSIACAACISYSQNILHRAGLDAPQNSVQFARLATYQGNRNGGIKTIVLRDVRDVGITVTDPLQTIASNSQLNRNTGAASTNTNAADATRFKNRSG
jgi:hypothetical protein